MTVYAVMIFLFLTAFYIRDCKAYLTEKPSFIKTCYIKDPNFTTCNIESVQKFFTHLKNGIPEAGVIPIDPLRVAEIRLLQGSGPVSINATLNKVSVYGFSKAIVKSNKVYPQRGYSFVTKLRLPQVRIEGDYNVQGRILLLPLVGKGSCWFEPRNLDVEANQEINIIKKGNYKFFNLTGIHIKFEMEGLKMRLNNLFNGAKQLEETTNAYLNANWKAASDSLKPILRKTIGDILAMVLKKVFDEIPGDFFIGDIEA